MKRILVIDGNSIVNRAYYGVRLLTAKNGKYTNAIYGTVNMISKQLELLKPDYAVAAFDLKHPTFRHRLYEHYKEGRHPTPPELLSQFPDVKEILTLMGIKVMELPGWEADDIQGTVASMAQGTDDTESYILSGDRDLLQLIEDRITVLLATNSDTLIMKREQFKEKYGIEPEYFVEMKALMGDSSDNIPGVGGVGEKTAAGLIKSFKTLEGIYENINDKTITKGVREKLLRDKEQAFLSRRLAKIDTNAPLGITLDDIKYLGFNKPELYKKFNELELKSFITKFNLDASEPEATASSTSVQGEYHAVSAKELSTLTGSTIALDFQDDCKLYITSDGKNMLYEGDVKDISDFIEGKRIICYDGKAIWHRLDKAGVKADTGIYIDLMLYEYLLNPGSGNAGVESLCSMFLGKAIKHNSPATFIYSELEGALLSQIEEKGMKHLLYDVELPLIKVLARMEKQGFKINKEGIAEFGDALGELANELAERIYMQAGEVFNLNSPKQLSEVLYAKMGLCPPGKKKGSSPSTDAQTLESMRTISPIIDDILEYRQVTKLRSTYTSALTEVADGNGRIHTDFKQALTATGRLSSAEPNLQNIPIRTKMGRELRRFFIADDGYTLVDADYSQIELRLLAHISGDYTMTEAFKSNEDIHRKTASAVFGVSEEFVDDDMRKRAKAVNFGIVYGIGGYSLAKDIGTTVAEASRYIKSYMMNYPDIDRYLDEVVRDAERDGYTTTLLGRRRYIPELKATQAQTRAFGKRVAMNAPIQGSAADVMKLAMLRVSEALEKEVPEAHLVMQVHDELIVEAPDNRVEDVKALLKKQMEAAIELSLPLTVDVTSGKNWLEQH